MSWQGNQRDAAARVEFVTIRTSAEAVPCPEPGCAAPAGTTCTNLLTGDPLGYLPAHDKRIKEARG